MDKTVSKYRCGIAQVRGSDSAPAGLGHVAAGPGVPRWREERTKAPVLHCVVRPFDCVAVIQGLARCCLGLVFGALRYSSIHASLGLV